MCGVSTSSYFNSLFRPAAVIAVPLILIVLILSSCENDPYCRVRLLMEMPGLEYSIGETVVVDLVLVNASGETLRFDGRDTPATTLSVFSGNKLIWDLRTLELRDPNLMFFDTSFELEPYQRKQLRRDVWRQIDFDGNNVGPGSYLLRGEFRTHRPGTDYTEKRWITIVPSQ